LVRDIIPVIHNPTSVQKLLEAVRISLGFGLRTIVVTRATGAAAQQGVPEAYKWVLRSGANLIVLPDLEDAVELLKPESTYLLGTRGDEVNPRGRSLIVINASEQPFLQKELSLGKPAKVVGRDIGSVGFLALALSKILQPCID